MYHITETDHLEIPELEIYTDLSETQLYHCREPQTGLFIAESPKVIERALDAGYKPVSLLVDEQELHKDASRILERLGAMPGDPVPVFAAREEILRKLTGFPLTRGCLCAMERRTLPSIEETVREASRIAVLEEVVNPTNVGAQIPWTFAGDRREPGWPKPGITRLRKLGFKTVAMALRRDSLSVSDPALQREPRLAVLLGTEGEGLLEETIALCDYTVMIPMYHGVDSLNVAAASAVAFWELAKRSCINPAFRPDLKC